MIPREGIGLCIIAPVIIMVLFVIILRFCNFSFIPKDMALPPPKKKTNLMSILTDVVKARKENENSDDSEGED
jgi:hypothetical protein